MYAYRESHNSGVIGLDGDKIIGDNCHCMIVDAELLDSCSACIDKAQSYPLPTGEFERRETCVVRARSSVTDSGAVKIHFAIDEVVIRRRSDQTGVCTHDSRKQGEIIVMIPITDSYWTKIDVVGFMLRTVNNERTP